jgi:hypothetical protein
MSQHGKRKARRGRKLLHERFIDGIRRLLFPRPTTMALGLPHHQGGKRGQIIGFTIALVLMVITALTVIAVEGGFQPSDAPVEQ